MTAETMSALLYRGPWEMEPARLPKPRPAAGEVLLKIEAVGICGSDVHGFTGQSGRRKPDMVMGHEAAGRVAAWGAEVDAPPVGTRVVLFNVVGCGACPDCRAGDAQRCPERQVFGVNMGRRGAMAQYLAVPAANAIPLPDSVDAELGLLAEPLAVVTHGWERLESLNVRPKRLAVVGAGTIGLSAVLLARRKGTRDVAVLDTVPEKAERAADFGASPVVVSPDENAEAAASRAIQALTDSADVAVDAVGTEASFRLCLALVRPGGVLLLIGNLAKTVSLPLQDVISTEVTLVGTYGFNREAFQAALEMLPELADDLGTFVEHHCTLAETPEVMTALAKGERHALKVVIRI